MLDDLIQQWSAAWRDAQRDAPAWVSQWRSLAQSLGLPDDTPEQVVAWLVTFAPDSDALRTWLEQLTSGTAEADAARRVQAIAAQLSAWLVDLAMRRADERVALDEWASPWLERLSAALVDASMRGFSSRSFRGRDDAPSD